jgi:hypothetical protein
MSDTSMQLPDSPKVPVDEFNKNDMGQLMRLANTFASSDLVPRDYQGKPANCFVAMQHGYKLGLDPLAALQSIASINGKPGLYGDAALGLVKQHPEFVDCEETFPDKCTAQCTIVRRGKIPVTRTFTVDDAKLAKLWGKQGPWSQYPRRMLQMRARSWAIRDSFPDALMGLGIVEEIRDTTIPVAATVTDSATGKGVAGLKNRLVGPSFDIVTIDDVSCVDEGERVIASDYDRTEIKPPPFEDMDIDPELVETESQEVPCDSDPIDRGKLIRQLYDAGKKKFGATNASEFWAAASGEDYLGREVSRVLDVDTEELGLLLELIEGE